MPAPAPTDAPAIRLAGWVEESCVDGPGLRMAIFTQGCPHRCPDCHNPETHAFEDGRLVETAELLSRFDRNPLLAGITLSGGEPMAQAGALAPLAEAVRARGRTVWCFSGYTFEELIARQEVDADIRRLCRAVDVLVDGRFERARLTRSLRFRGSANQRILDLPRSLDAQRPVSLPGVDGA